MFNVENAVGFTSQELSGETETFTLWILTILSPLKSPGRKKSERRGWEEDEESAENLGKSM